jgi:hypothetical protein
MSTWKTIGQLIEMKGTVPAEEPVAEAAAPKTYKTIEAAARALAKAKGWKGGRGGWIFDPSKKGLPTLAQGYLGLGMRMQKRGLIAGNPTTGYRIVEG